jgi:hypothetical protein
VKVVNESHRALSDVLPLVEFVAARTTYADMAYLHLHPGQYLDDGTPLVARGQALKDNDNPAGRTPSRVDLWLAKGVCFPRDDEYPEAGVGIVVLEDWREEFILALAHELRHIFQWWSTLPGTDPNPEHDAESWAVKVLNEWRSEMGREPATPVRTQSTDMCNVHVRTVGRSQMSSSSPTRRVAARGNIAQSASRTRSSGAARWWRA